MNRKLKFRIWDKIGKLFRGNLNKYCLNAQTGELEVWAYSDLYDEWYNTREDGEDFVIQQYTGLKDKNGNDIYEGDIVKTDPEHLTAILQTIRESDRYTEYTNGIVRRVNEGFCICQTYIGATRISEYSSCNCCSCGLEIIGNIMENPELIK